MRSGGKDHVGRDVLRDRLRDTGLPVSQILSAIAGYVFAFLMGELSGMSDLDIIVFGLIVAVCAWLAYEAAHFHRATNEAQSAARQMEAAMDRFSAKSLTINHRVESYTVHCGWVTHRTTIILTNNTSEVCTQFRYGICRETILDRAEFRIWINGYVLSNVPGSKYDVMRNERTSLSGKDGVSCRYMYDIYIPLDLLPNRTCTIEIEDVGGASMDNLLRCKMEDMAAVWIHIPTHILEISFDLDEEMARNHILEARRNIGTTPTEVYDHCGNRMNMYEAEVCDRNRPSADGRSVRWTVMEPVVGFSYRLYLMMQRSK